MKCCQNWNKKHKLPLKSDPSSGQSRFLLLVPKIYDQKIDRKKQQFFLSSKN